MNFKKLTLLFISLLLFRDAGYAKDHEITGKQRLGNNWSNIPILIFPGITQEEFADAFKVLEEAYVHASNENPVYGFIYPFCGPGGGYGPCWWQLDTSLALSGIKWVNQEFAENVLRNFIYVQQENGRIALWGMQSDDLIHSSLPKLFQISHEVLKGTKDEQLIRDTYSMLKKYLDWWLSERWDDKSGLIKGISEEWLPGAWEFYLPVETNVEVIAGCNIVAKLADYNNDKDSALFYGEKAEALKKMINEFLWNDEEKCFMNLAVKNYTFEGSVYSVTAFDPLKLNVADKKYHGFMLEALTDDNLFQWGSIPLTSAAKTVPQYNETPGVYVGHQWYGSIWSLRNYAVLEGLEDIGRYDLASHLAIRTVELFNNNYAEFINPPNGSGEGVLRYSWTASQYIQILIEHIFGITFDQFTNTLSIKPHLDTSLTGQTIELKQLLLPNSSKLDVEITSGVTEVRVNYQVTESPKMNVVISLPTYNQRTSAVNSKHKNVNVGYGQVCIVENGEKYYDEIIFNRMN